MVVIHNAGIRIVDAWIDHPNVTAVVYAHLVRFHEFSVVSMVYTDLFCSLDRTPVALSST